MKHLKYLKKSKYNDLEDMVCRFQLTYDEFIEILNLKCIPTTNIRYTLPPGLYEIVNNNFMLMSLRPGEVKLNIATDDIRLKSNLATNKTINFTKKSFFYIILGFIESHPGGLGVIPGFIQLIPGSYKGEKPINLTRIDKIHLKCDCINVSIVNGVH